MRLFTSCGGKIRTCDLWVMSPTSCHCSTPRYIFKFTNQRTKSKDSNLRPDVSRDMSPTSCHCSTPRYGENTPRVFRSAKVVLFINITK